MATDELAPEADQLAPVAGAPVGRDRSLRARASRLLRQRPEIAVLLAAYAALMFLVINTQQWFFADEWEFIVNRDRPGWTDLQGWADMLLTPHNEHWSTVPIIAYRGLFAIVGLREHWPYEMAHMLVHIAMAWLLIRRMRADGVSQAVLLGLTTLFLFYGPGSENILWVFQLTVLGSVVLGLLWLEALGAERSGSVGDGKADAGDAFSARRIRLGWLFGVASLATSGLGPPMVVVAGVYALVRRGWRTALKVVIVPGIAYVAWWVTYGHKGTEQTDIDAAMVAQRIVPYVWRSIMAMFDETLGLAGLGPFITGALVVATVAHWPEMVRRHPMTLALAGGAIAMPLIVAVGRVQLDQPNASRYLYLELVFVIPLLALHTTRLLRWAAERGRGRPVGVALATVAGVALFTSFGTLVHRASDEGKRERQMRDEITAAFALARSTFVSPDAFPELGSLDLRMSDVRRLVNRGIVPWGSPSARALAIVGSRTTVDVTGHPRVPLEPTAVEIVSRGRSDVRAAETGCIALVAIGPQPQIKFRVQKRVSLKFVPQVAGFLRIYVRRDGFAAPAIPVEIAGNNPIFVNLIDPRAEYVLEYPDQGISKICGVGQNIPPLQGE